MKFNPFFGIHAVVPSTNERQRIANGEVTGQFECARPDCRFIGTLAEGTEHAIKNQFEVTKELARG